ncbi:hypothetical protein [Fusibacter ferrireducens]|uniref:Flagellar protein n=1 Tax=Fusibacter ferrireducens TaxID=2785058 RepID=A0ABR9ZVL6_9FIRM|nr:hypothetical protein [Fusibacter ferrireducens]MBF4694510.1 hypothetical protein [Fusibacter ferrireducens]
MTENKLGNLKNCKKCNRLFAAPDASSSLCSRCNEAIDDDFTKVREYIYDNPTSGVKDVSIGTGVSTEAILKWIRDGKIVLGANALISFCERCGEVVNGGGRFCPKCIRSLTDGLKAGMDSNDSHRPRGGMHIREKNNLKKD